jgi:hypothetical protein
MTNYGFLSMTENAVWNIPLKLAWKFSTSGGGGGRL